MVSEREASTTEAADTRRAVKWIQDGIAVKLRCSHGEVQLPSTGTIGCALCGKRCCGSASGRDKDQRSLNEAPSTREVLETSGDTFSPVRKVKDLLERSQFDCGKWITDLMKMVTPETPSLAGAGEKLYFNVKCLITDWTMDLITVEATRKEQQEQTTAQEQGKKVCFTEEEKEAQEAREWLENFTRARGARGEQSREQEKKGSEEDDDERVGGA